MSKRGILVIGHGSSYGYNVKAVDLQVERLRNMGYGNVYAGFNKMSHPTIGEALDAMAADGVDDIVAVPFFIASGLHMSDEIPPKLGLADGCRDACVDIGGRRVRMRLATPFGDDPAVATILHETIGELASSDGRRVGAMVVGHGSKLPFNKQIMELNAERLREMGHKDVRVAFNELDEPLIEDVLAEMAADGVDEVVVMPLFISLGHHLKCDVPPKIMLEDGETSGSFEAGGRTVSVKYAMPIGRDPRITELLAKKIDGLA